MINLSAVSVLNMDNYTCRSVFVQVFMGAPRAAIRRRTVDISLMCSRALFLLQLRNSNTYSTSFCVLVNARYVTLLITGLQDHSLEFISSFLPASMSFLKRWKSRSKGRRPRIPKEAQDLIYRLSKENPLWSPEWIKNTFILLQYNPSCEDTIRKYMYKPRKPWASLLTYT